MRRAAVSVFPVVRGRGPACEGGFAGRTDTGYRATIGRYTCDRNSSSLRPASLMIFFMSPEKPRAWRGQPPVYQALEQRCGVARLRQRMSLRATTVIRRKPKPTTDALCQKRKYETWVDSLVAQRIDRMQQGGPLSRKVAKHKTDSCRNSEGKYDVAGFQQCREITNSTDHS